MTASNRVSVIWMRSPVSREAEVEIRIVSDFAHAQAGFTAAECAAIERYVALIRSWTEDATWVDGQRAENRVPPDVSDLSGRDTDAGTQRVLPAHSSRAGEPERTPE